MATIWTKHIVLLACILLSIGACLVSASPLPQDLNQASNNSLVDPFSAPDSQATTKFTWENFIYGILFIFFGGVEVLHGYRYIRFTMLVAGFLVWSSTAVMIMIIVNTGSGSYLSSELYFLIWLAVGIVGSLVSFYLYHVGIVLTGAYGVFVVIAIIFTATNLRNYIVRYTLLVIFVILGGYLTKRYERIAVILATSVGGAYMMMFGLDMFVQTGFRATYHVILSQSKAEFKPNVGTWVMVACVPVIAIFGIIWELMHHETPVGSWWFGIGAKPLPETPGEKPRRCCCFLLAAKRPKVPPKDIPSGSDTTLVDLESGKGGGGCCGARKKAPKKGATITVSPSTVALTQPTPPVAVTAETIPSPYDDVEPGSPVDEKAVVAAPASVPATAVSSAEKTTKLPHETIGHTGFRKVVIEREEHEFSLDLSERF
ncbi:hypothetical protein BG005_011228 [Podila minutissima]|nr:hypothetical protein BG005_011228 [Podila minutissima]